MIDKEGTLVKKSIARVIIPLIQLFALYVIVHGDSGPGGGFQGGVILGSSFILYSIIFGAKAGRAWVKQSVTDVFNSAGVLIYAAVGIVALLVGGKFLEYNVLPIGHDAHVASHYGIFFIEIGVGVTVAAVMVTIFFETAERDEEDEKIGDETDG
jgi:multicomponent Na+:H+ antiporter subunit B